MKKLKFIFLTVILLVPALAITAAAQPKQPKKNKTKPKPAASVKEEEIVSALREALSSGANRAGVELSRQGGFYNDARYKLPVPPALQALEKKLRALGHGDMFDDLVVAINRAAEQTAGEAAFVLKDEIGKITFADAKKLLAGPKDAATQYFRRTGEKALLAKVIPLVNTATSEAGALTLYKALEEKNGAKITGFDIDEYVAGKTLDAMFLVIAAEEKRIREVPAARTTAILQKVFGGITK
jgi:hypothetical protein